MSRRTKRMVIIAIFFGLPVLALLGIAWGIAYWSDWRGGMVLLTIGIVVLAVHAVRDAI